MQLGKGDSDSGSATLRALEPAMMLQAIEAQYASFSRGFLQSRPERWFPGFSAQWFPLAHSLGAEVQISEVLPSVELPQDFEVGFLASVDNDHISVVVENQDARVLIKELFPGSTKAVSLICLEYLARRFLTSLILSWTGPESSALLIEGKLERESLESKNFVASIRLNLLINQQHCSLWVLLSRGVADKLDRLWKRQMQSSERNNTGPDLFGVVQIAELAVPITSLADYTRPGTVIDLEVFVSDAARVTFSARESLIVRLCSVDNKLAFQVREEDSSVSNIPEGSARISFNLAKFSCPGSMLPELSQVGAIYATNQPVTNEVEVMVNGKQVATAELSDYQGRFAATIK
jgi:hypothetical protein